MEFADHLQQVCAAVAEFRGEQHTVTPERVIRTGPGSLGIDGDDAVELLIHLHEQFGTSFEDFPYDRYFGPEGLPISALWQWLTGASQHLEKFTVGDLARWMWNERQAST